MNENETLFLLNKFWIKEILKMNNENDLNPDVLAASDSDYFNIIEKIHLLLLFSNTKHK